jgi:hypothetical protein
MAAADLQLPEILIGMLVGRGGGTIVCRDRGSNEGMRGSGRRP